MFRNIAVGSLLTIGKIAKDPTFLLVGSGLLILFTTDVASDALAIFEPMMSGIDALTVAFK